MSATKPKANAAKEEPKQEVAVTQTSGALANVVPDFMKGMAGQGVENMSGADVETPRLLLLQATSPQVEDYENARAGLFWHNMTNEPMGKSLEVVISYVDKRAILWRPRPPIDTGGILARSEDCINWNPPNAEFKVKIDKSGKEVIWRTKRGVVSSGLLDWGTFDPSDPNSQPAATLMYNFVLSFPQFPDTPPAVFSFQRSTSKVAKKLMGRLKMLSVPTFGMKFMFESFTEENNGQKYQSLRVTPNGYVENQDDFSRYKALYDAMKVTGLKMSEEPEYHDPVSTGGDTGEGPEY